MSEKSLFDDLMLSLDQAMEHAAGDQTKARTRTVSIKETVSFTAQDVKQIRQQLGLTQKSFAILMGVSAKTIESWERGVNHPSGSASRLLEIIGNAPEVVKDQEILLKTQ